MSLKRGSAAALCLLLLGCGSRSGLSEPLATDPADAASDAKPDGGSVVPDAAPDAEPDAAACDPPFADCNGDPSDGCETNLQQDPAHCGKCFRSCLGAACVAGQCEAVTFASGQDSPLGIAVVDNTVYWTNESSAGTVMAQNTLMEAPAVLAAGQAFPRWIAATPNEVYWTNYAGGFQGNVMRVVLTSPTAGFPYVVAEDQGGPDGIAIDQQRVYWTNFASGSNVASANKNGSDFSVIAPNQANPSGVAVDGSRVYWTSLDGSVRSRNKQGGDQVTHAGGQDGPTALALNAGYLYWTNYNGGQVMRVALQGSATPPQTLDASGERPLGIAVDGQHVYWTDFTRGTVKRVPKAGGKSELIAKDQKNPAGIAVDDKAVYWVNRGGQVMLRAK